MDPIAALQWVQNFYEQAWNKLIWVVGAGFAIVGLLMPILIQLYQRKSFKDEMDRLEKEANRQIDESKRHFAEEAEKMKKEIEERIREETTELRKAHQRALGYVTMVQAQMQAADGRIGDAVRDFAYAAGFLIEGEEYANFSRAVSAVKQWLLRLDQNDFKNNEGIGKSLDVLMKGMSEEKQEYRYRHEVVEIKRLWDEAMAREPKAE